MNKFIITSLLAIILFGCHIQAKTNLNPISLKIIDQHYEIYNISMVESIYNIQNLQLPEEYKLPHKGIVKILVLLFLCCLTLIIVMTPLVLIYCWIYYSFNYVKNFRNNNELKDLIVENRHIDYENLSKSYWLEYRRIYSKMIGFGLAIIAYGISSNIYMFSSFNKIEIALIDYFNFPFKVLNGLRTMDEPPLKNFPLKELWFEMLFIVCISILVFFLGYFIGKTIVDIRSKPIRI